MSQFAFVGRSNVGKSSLLNALTRQKVARTSAAAGKTRLANIYRVTAEGGAGGPGPWSTYLVDLPGYGYARGGAASVKELSAVVDAYFAAGQRTSGSGSDRERRGAIFLLVDSRHPGLATDVQAYQWLGDTAVTPHIIATKVDKLSRNDRSKNLREFERIFGRPPIPVSVTSGEGIDDLWRMISGLARGVEIS